MLSQDKILIGRKEQACFFSIKIKGIGVKIDSGAYSCSIDCSHIELVDFEGSTCLEVVFLQVKDSGFTGEKFYFKEFTKKKVTSSSGNAQFRYIISLPITFFGKTFNAPFSLTNRNGLRTSVLIGRKLLNKNFIIDTSRKYLSKNY